MNGDKRPAKLNTRESVAVLIDEAHRTRALLQEHTDSNLFELPDAIYELNEATLQRINESDASDTAKVQNLRKALYRTVTGESSSKPFLISIGERAEAIVERI